MMSPCGAAWALSNVLYIRLAGQWRAVLHRLPPFFGRRARRIIKFVSGVFLFFLSCGLCF